MISGFKKKDLSVLSYANGFTLWHFTTPDHLAEVCRAGYFEKAEDIFCSGDMIVINAGTCDDPQGTMVCVGKNDQAQIILRDAISLNSVESKSIAAGQLS